MLAKYSHTISIICHKISSWNQFLITCNFTWHDWCHSRGKGFIFSTVNGQLLARVVATPLNLVKRSWLEILHGGRYLRIHVYTTMFYQIFSPSSESYLKTYPLHFEAIFAQCLKSCLPNSKLCWKDYRIGCPILAKICQIILPKKYIVGDIIIKFCTDFQLFSQLSWSPAMSRNFCPDPFKSWKR